MSSPTNRSDHRPRVCILTETYYPVVGGGEMQAQMLAEDLVAHGLATAVVTRRSSPDLRRLEQIHGVMVYRIPPVGMVRSPRWRMIISAFWTLARVRRHYDVILVSGFKALGVPAVMIARLFGKACILKADSNGEMSGDFFASGLKRVGMTTRSRLFRAGLAARNVFLRRADCFVAITSGIARELERQGIDPGAIRPVTNGVDTSRFRPVPRCEKTSLRRRLGLPDASVIVTYTGRLVTYKGVWTLIEAAKVFRRQRDDVVFVLLGSGGLDMHNCEAELRAHVLDSGLSSTVRFAGEIANVHEYLQASDVFVFPSEDDAFPLAVVEAMACGLPVVATKVGGIADIITHRKDGFLIDPGSVPQLCDALNSVAADSDLAAALGAAAVRTTRARYSRETIAREYVRLLECSWT